MAVNFRPTSPAKKPAYRLIFSEKRRQRIVYRPDEVHDYSTDKPSFREILPGHFVLCNDKEEAQYKKEIEALDKGDIVLRGGVEVRKDEQ